MEYSYNGRVAFCQDDEGNDVWAIDTHDLSPNAARFVKHYVTREWLQEDHPDFDTLISSVAATEERGVLAELYVLSLQLTSATISAADTLYIKAMQARDLGFETALRLAEQEHQDGSER